ncbi:hypothetical protein [Haloarchaeobius sp. TZWWS8]|uniref:hypothetical protein n=1 Tax=Haloarchaeobius sp. TZWWS8 TaxID=3446121 RepID=UPI003EBAFD50
MPSRKTLLALGLLLSVAITVVLWVVFDTLAVFLFLPLVPFVLGRGGDGAPVRRCPVCGFETADDGFEYCPRDGERLE